MTRSGKLEIFRRGSYCTYCVLLPGLPFDSPILSIIHSFMLELAILLSFFSLSLSISVLIFFVLTSLYFLTSSVFFILVCALISADYFCPGTMELSLVFYLLLFYFVCFPHGSLS